MENNIMILLGLSIPFIGTTLGAAMVFFLKKDMKPKVKGMLAGFAAGVMIAASIWSLLMPAMEMAEEQGQPGWVPAAVGFMAGILFLLFLDTIIPHLHSDKKKPEGVKAKLKNTTMLMLAITLHNIPEGMAVGVVIASALTQDIGLAAAGAIALAIGIGIQNFPEGAIVSMPLKSEGIGKFKAFMYSALSGIVEPIAAIITIAITGLVIPILPFILAFAAGAMIYVVVEELIPEIHEGGHSNIGTIAVAVGFVIMMVLDCTLG